MVTSLVSVPCVAVAVAMTGAGVEALCGQLLARVGDECGHPVMSIILDTLAQPVDQDSRYAALHVLKALAMFTSGWGLRVMFTFPGCLEYFNSTCVWDGWPSSLCCHRVEK